MNSFGEKVDLSPFHCDKFLLDDVFQTTKRQRIEKPNEKIDVKKMSLHSIQGSTARATPESGRVDANANFTSVAEKAVQGMMLKDE